MIDYENEDLNKFPSFMIKKFLREVKMFSGIRSKQKFVDWCVNQCLYQELAIIAMIDYKHV